MGDPNFDDQSAWAAYLSTSPTEAHQPSFNAGRRYARADTRALLQGLFTALRQSLMPHAEQGPAPVSPCERRTEYGTLACTACAAAERITEIRRVWEIDMVYPS